MVDVEVVLTDELSTIVFSQRHERELGLLSSLAFDRNLSRQDRLIVFNNCIRQLV